MRELRFCRAPSQFCLLWVHQASIGSPVFGGLWGQALAATSSELKSAWMIAQGWSTPSRFALSLDAMNVDAASAFAKKDPKAQDGVLTGVSEMRSACRGVSRGLAGWYLVSSSE